MNLLHVTPYYAPAWAYGGVVQAVTGLAEAQAARGHRVIVLTTDALDRSRRVAVREEVTHGVHVVRRPNLLPTARGRWNLSTPLGFGPTAGRLLRGHSVHLIHCHELRTLENLLVAPYARRAGVPVVVSPHGTLPYRTGRRLAKMVWDRTLGRRWMQSVDQVISLTASERNETLRLWSKFGAALPDHRAVVVPNGVNPAPLLPSKVREAFRGQWRLGNGPVLLFLGRLAMRKGLPLLVSAFAELAEEFPEARLLLVGPNEGALPHLTDRVRRLHLETRVVFTGLLVGAEKDHALAASDLLVMPSIGEGLSMAVLEGLASGLPVVLTEDPGVPEVVAVGAGLLSDPDVEPLARALRSLLADPDVRGRMGRSGRELVSSFYSWAHVVTKMDDSYQAVLGRGPRSTV